MQAVRTLLQQLRVLKHLTLQAHTPRSGFSRVARLCMHGAPDTKFLHQIHALLSWRQLPGNQSQG